MQKFTIPKSASAAATTSKLVKRMENTNFELKTRFLPRNRVFSLFVGCAKQLFGFKLALTHGGLETGFFY